ncbi:MAG: methylated-DNA--[protein]-cysteine S-methyltransferase [Burkholderiales bacterium]|nr:methylated-DNA--[protein]-cysteine S-methyltransferase [Bacteroidia bacterium]
MNDSFDISYFESPIGLIQIKSINQKICSVLFVEKETEPFTIDTPLNKECIRQLKEYFAGTRLKFDIPIFQIGTDFQQLVWNELLNTPYGTTLSYGQIARKIGDIKSVRAVGTTNGKNKISIIVPCHRVIGSDGSLTGYAGELWRKEWLLKHEVEHSGPIEGRLF